MPAIIKEDKQVTALREIENALAVIKTINSAIAGESQFTLVTTPAGSRSAIKITLDDKDTPKVISVLNAQRSRLVKEVKSKATKCRIALDDADIACMEGQVPGKKVKPSVEPVEVASEEEETAESESGEDLSLFDSEDVSIPEEYSDYGGGET